MGQDGFRAGAHNVAARPELIARLGRADAIVLVVAAAGYGKTRLLRDWESHDPRSFRRLSPRAVADHAHDTAAREPEVVVVDDLDARASSTPGFLTAVHALAARAGTAVVLAGRSIDPGVATRLTLDADVLTIDEDDLAFDDVRAKALLGDRCDDTGVALLVDRTEGWPAALRLAAVALDDGVDVASFTGRDRSVRQYLESTVFKDVDAETLGFLRSCSVFDTLDAGLCDHALDRRDSHELLVRLEASHLFVRSLDRNREQFAMHPLVRQAFEAQLRAIDPDAVSALRRRGADWLVQNGRSRQGLVLRLTDGDGDGAAELLADIVLPMFSTGDLDPLVGLIHQIGADVAIRHGFLATMFAYAGVMTGDHAAAERWCLMAQRFYATHRFGSSDEEVAYFTLRAHLAPDGLAVMEDDARHALGISEESSPWRVPALMLAGTAALLQGDAAAARSLLDEAVHRSAETAIRPALVMSLAERALLSAIEGSQSAIRDDLDAALEAIGDELRDYPLTALVWALVALYRHRDGDDAAARTAFQTANGLRPAAGRTIPWLGVQLREVLARVAVALGDVDMARSLLGESRVLLEILPDAPTLHRGVAAIERAVAPLPTGRAELPLLTAAELRVLPMLSSHLSFEEIGGRLYVSRYTIKSQAISIYRKLGVSSRSDAVVHARDLGLIEV